jgi:glycosyltransferase involved in cell wall biosynthesis
MIENKVDKLVIKYSSHIVSVSNDCVRSLNNRPSFRGCKKTVCIYNGIDDPVRTFSLESRSESIKRVKKNYCLMLATYESRKGHEYLLKAFKHVVQDFPNVELKIFGHGRVHEKKRVTDVVKNLGLESNVALSDFTKDTAELLAGASLLVVPSQDYESFGLTIIEAMAFGVPVVVTNVGGMPEVLGDSRAGYICSKEDPLEFAYAIKLILGNVEHALDLGLNGRREFLNRFSAQVMAQKYASIIVGNS